MNEFQNAENQGLVRGMTYETENEKVYLILIKGEIDGDEYRDWNFKTGRQEAYDFIKFVLETDYLIVDVIESKIIVNAPSVTIDDGVPIFSFMKSMKDNNKVIDETSFDITDYIPGGEIEGVE